MSFQNGSGVSTPLSSSTAFSLPSSPRILATDAFEPSIYHNPRVSASNIVEFIASHQKSSSSVYIYDLAYQAGFGALTREWSKSSPDAVPVVDLQTRAGAGLSLVGRLSEGTSQDTVKGAVLTAYTTPSGLSAMAPSLLHLPHSAPSSRLIIQVPTIITVGNTFSLSPSLAPLASVWPMLPKDIVVLLSATPQQTVDFAALSYKLQSHVIHLFDHQSSSRETGHSITSLHSKDVEGGTVSEIINYAGHKFFDYVGDAEAHTVIIMLNGPLALYTMALAGQTAGLGVITVNVLRPWDESALRTILPTSVRKVHVIDDVPTMAAQGALYIDVFGTLLESGADLSVHPHRLSPSQTQQYMNQAGSFLQFLGSIVPSLNTDSQFQLPSVKKLLLFSNPQSPLSLLSTLVQDLFFPSKGISARSLSDHDAFSKTGGISATRMLLSPRNNISDNVPIPLIMPWLPSSNGEVDFLGVLDQSLLKSHSIVNCAKRGSSVLVVTGWSSDELSSNLAPVVSIITEKKLRLFTINAKEIASTTSAALGPAKLVEPLLAYLALVRLYLAAAATEATVLKLAEASLGQFSETISLVKINAHAWSALEEVELKLSIGGVGPSASSLKEFVSNAITVDTNIGQAVANGAKLASWHDGAKHILFPAVFTPSVGLTSEEFPRIPSLHPEIPDRTFLVTCSVNRRLTPLEYNRNVFHLEFDTTGTGLKYAIGEALGVHGWNDEKEVLDFCEWYGVDPNRLITIPIAGGEGKMHTRTVFQALQQQIDLFGHPPKSFYTDLAAYASSPVDRHALLFIGSPEGSSTYKKFSEKDTVTFTDILAKYASGRPGIERLCEMIGDIKPRHYSIASAQSVVGNRVDLLVVTVEWVTSSGKCPS